MPKYKIYFSERFVVEVEADSEEDAWQQYSDKSLDDADGPRVLVEWNLDKSIEEAI